MDKNNLIGGIAILVFILGWSYIFFLDDSPNYKALYEETIYNQTLQSAFNNGSLLTELAIGNNLATCNPIPIRYIDNQNQTRTLNAIAMEC